MKFVLLLPLFFIYNYALAQIEPHAGTWKTWFISSGKDFRLPPPPDKKATSAEIKALLSVQQQRDSAAIYQVRYWNAGSPSYRWRDIVATIAEKDTTKEFNLTITLLNIAVYDATIAAWDTKYTYHRTRPATQNASIRTLIPTPDSPSYPCEHSLAAGVALELVSQFYPQKADSVLQLAKEAMRSRVIAGVQYPSDTVAGFQLGRTIARKAIESMKNYIPTTTWDGKIPQGSHLWTGKKPFRPLWGTWQPIVLSSAKQFRPGPPPDFTKDMEELKRFKPTFQSTARAYYYASQNVWLDITDKKVFEYNLHTNPPRAARIYALRSIAAWDMGIACWDAKYAYWGIRPDQLDTTYRPVLVPTPSFPGYPSGHATFDGGMAVVLSYLFPEDRKFFEEKAKEAAESRFEAGSHFRTDNEVGLELGRKVGKLVVESAKKDGAEEVPKIAKKL